MFFHADRHFYFATFWHTVAKDFKTRVTMKKIYSRGKSMKKHMIPKNSYLSDDTVCYYNRDYIGYQKHGNPDFINRLKNMTGRYDELDLVRDFLKVFDLAYKDIPQIIDEKHLENCAVAIIPRSKAEKTYDPSQLILEKQFHALQINSIFTTQQTRSGASPTQKQLTPGGWKTTPDKCPIEASQKSPAISIPLSFATKMSSWSTISIPKAFM